jgi:transcriptional regulator NrdR family protein
MTICPFCGSKNTDQDRFEDHGLEVHRKTFCRNCGSSWTEIFVYDGIYDIIEKHEEKKDANLSDE